MRRVGEAVTTMLVITVGCAVLMPIAAREEETSDVSGAVTIRKSKEGLNFTLPPDWPIEKRGGITAPIPIEEYLSRKFNAVESRLKLLEQQINGLDVRLRVLEEEKKRSHQGLQSSGSSVTP